jgi:hypothetical protein
LKASVYREMLKQGGVMFTGFRSAVKLYKNVSIRVELNADPQIFQKCRRYLEVLGARRLT